MAAKGSSRMIALFQGESRTGDVSYNLSRMKEQMRKASAVGADLLVFPELFLTGYKLQAAEAKRLAEEKNGPSFEELSVAAKEAGIAVVYGYPEVASSSDGSKTYYNSAQLIDRDGRSVMNYQKIHLWIDEHKYEEVFTPGENFSVVECCGLKIGILICYDIEFPECVRILALKGAQLIIVPTAIAVSGCLTIPNGMIPTRAMEGRVYVAYVNHSMSDAIDGKPFLGQSSCCSPSGDFVVKAGSEETLLFASISPNDFKGLYSYLKDMKPASYKDLVAFYTTNQ